MGDLILGLIVKTTAGAADASHCQVAFQRRRSLRPLEKGMMKMGLMMEMGRNFLTT